MGSVILKCTICSKKLKKSVVFDCFDIVLKILLSRLRSGWRDRVAEASTPPSQHICLEHVYYVSGHGRYRMIARTGPK